MSDKEELDKYILKFVWVIHNIFVISNQDNQMRCKNIRNDLYISSSYTSTFNSCKCTKRADNAFQMFLHSLCSGSPKQNYYFTTFKLRNNIPKHSGCSVILFVEQYHETKTKMHISHFRFDQRVDQSTSYFHSSKFVVMNSLNILQMILSFGETM